MAALPKRKHSTKRSGTRKRSKLISLAALKRYKNRNQLKVSR